MGLFYNTVTVTVTVTVILFKCSKNKRPRGLPLDIWLSRLHLELPYMQNVLAHVTPPHTCEREGLSHWQYHKAAAKLHFVAPSGSRSVHRTTHS
jgi:hypothetical protein